MAAQKITNVEKVAMDALRLAELLKQAIMDGTGAVEKRLSENQPSKTTTGKNA